MEDFNENTIEQTLNKAIIVPDQSWKNRTENKLWNLPENSVTDSENARNKTMILKLVFTQLFMTKKSASLIAFLALFFITITVSGIAGGYFILQDSKDTKSSSLSADQKYKILAKVVENNSTEVIAQSTTANQNDAKRSASPDSEAALSSYADTRLIAPYPAPIDPQNENNYRHTKVVVEKGSQFDYCGQSVLYGTDSAWESYEFYDASGKSYHKSSTGAAVSTSSVVIAVGA